MHAKSLQSCPTLCDPVDCSWPGSSVHGILLRQEYWNGMLCPPPGDLPYPGIKPISLTYNLHWQAGSLPLAPPGKPYMQSTSCEMLGWLNHKLESRLPGEIQQSQICRWYHSNSRKQRGTKEPLDEGERGEWKSWLKTQHLKNKYHGSWSHHFMANWWGKSGNCDRYSFLGSKITMDSDCTHRIKRCFLLGRKSVTKLDSILISRDITLPTKVHLVKAMVFPVVMYGCERWTIKKAEC